MVGRPKRNSDSAIDEVVRKAGKASKVAARIEIFDNCDYVSASAVTLKDASDSQIIENSIYTSEGGYATVFDLKGLARALDHRQQDEELTLLGQKLKKTFERPGHRIDFYFTKDKSRAKHAVFAAMAGSMQTARNVGLDVDSVFRDRADRLSQFVHYESALLVLKSTSNCLPDRVKEQVFEARKAAGSSKTFGAFSANPAQEIGGALAAYHAASVKRFVRATSGFVEFRQLTLDAAGRAMRGVIAPTLTSSNWSPVFWGDKIEAKLSLDKTDSLDMSHLSIPALGLQLVPFPLYETHDRSIIEVGDRFMAPVFLYRAPAGTPRFSELFEALATDIPYTYTMSLETGTDLIKAKVARKKNIAQFLRLFDFGGASNKKIVSSGAYLLKKFDEGQPLFAFRGVFCTWGSTLEEAKERKQQLIEDVGSWGQSELRENREDPGTLFLESVPGFVRDKTTPPAVQPFLDAMRMAPIDRPSCLWGAGSLILRSDCGKILPYEMLSRIQTTWNGYTYALPGSGKTVLVMGKMLSLILGENQAKLPYICFLDVGHSGEGLHDFLQSVLPTSRKGESILVNMELSSEMRINPWDTQLGCDLPTPAEKGFIELFTESLLFGSERNKTQEMTDVVVALVDRAYKRTAKESPSIYAPGVEMSVDRALEKHKVTFDHEDDIWWKEVRDALFAKGLVEEASLAHRNAVPNFSSLSLMVKTDEVLESRFKQILINGVSALEVLHTRIASALTKYPNLTGASSFNFGVGRVISFNMREVTANDTEEAIRQTQIMYLLAAKAGGGHFWVDSERMSSVPRLYHKFHETRFKEIESTKKLMVYEEFHLPSGRGAGEDIVTAITKRAITEMRTGRKHLVGVEVVSQSDKDITKEMVDQLSSCWILDCGTDEQISRLKSLFQLPEEIASQMRVKLTGPDSGGSNILMLTKAKKKGWDYKFVRYTLGSQEMWALCSTRVDVSLRRALRRKIGFMEALKVLGDNFPGGTAEEEIMVFERHFSKLPQDLAGAALQNWDEVISEHLINLSVEEVSQVLRGHKAIDKSYIPT